jgi:hypothetical protein
MSRRRPVARPWRACRTALALVAMVLLGGCADTLQNAPLKDRDLEVAALNNKFPVYWVGRAFEGYSISNVTQDSDGALSLAYGDCVIGGQAVCLTPLLIVTSPDNSFVPGTGPHNHAVIRGRRVTVAQDGRTIAIPTGAVVVSVFGQTPAIAQASARSLMPINQTGTPAAPLPAPTGDSGYARTPLGGPTPTFATPPAAGVSGDAQVGGPPS